MSLGSAIVDFMTVALLPPYKAFVFPPPRRTKPGGVAGQDSGRTGGNSALTVRVVVKKYRSAGAAADELMEYC